MSHISGLIAGNSHSSPIDFADLVTSTTHKTLRGPRGAMALSNNESIIKRIKDLMKERFFYTKNDLLTLIAIVLIFCIYPWPTSPWPVYYAYFFSKLILCLHKA